MRSERGPWWWTARAIGAGVLLIATTAAGPTHTAARQAPAGQDAPAPFAAPECLACHGVDLITQQRLSPPAWAREVEKMIRWGAPVAPEKKEALVADFASRFRPGPAPQPPSVAPARAGEDVYNRACIVCHGADLVEQQRLTLAGWTREVGKMVAWGAPVSEAERPVLAAYLAARLPPR